MAEVLEYRPNGTRWKYIKQHSRVRHQPYDYESKGLLTKLLPEHVLATDNDTTRAVFDFVEDICVRLLKYVDNLRHFKDWNYKQY